MSGPGSSLLVPTSSRGEIIKSERIVGATQVALACSKPPTHMNGTLDKSWKGAEVLDKAEWASMVCQKLDFLIVCAQVISLFIQVTQKAYTCSLPSACHAFGSHVCRDVMH